jgi:hypothetical protein
MQRRVLICDSLPPPRDHNIHQIRGQNSFSNENHSIFTNYRLNIDIKRHCRKEKKKHTESVPFIYVKEC